jgi:polyhydroxybutyrate depolymerase
MVPCMIRLLAFLLLFAGPALACTGQTPCQLGERSYHVREPDGWNGTEPLPVLIHFHGWQRQGTLVVRHNRIASATRKRGVLLVAPNGLGRTWDFWRPTTDDVPFARAVLEDVRARYPVDPARVYVSGYSWGSSMAWRFACEDGADIAALLAISGTLRQDETCPEAPGEVRQVYGLNDQVLDFPYGPDGDTSHPVKLWRDTFGCGAGTPKGDWRQVPFLTLTRTAWEDCATGRVSLDLHPGGHFIPHGWIARQLDEMLGLPPSYP